MEFQYRMSDRELFFLLERALLPTEHANLIHDGIHYTRVSVDDIYKQLLNANIGCKTFFVAGCDHLAEILTRLAEAAIHQGNFDIAQKAVSWFLRDIRLRNQLYCRILFAQAICHVHLVADEKGGVPRVHAIMEAIEFVLQVIEFALRKEYRPRYDFLVYNSSVIYWRIARSLMKPNTIRFLISSLTTIIDALKIVAESDILWTARLKVTLVQACMDDAQNAYAAQSITEVIEKMLVPFLSDTAALNKLTLENKREAYKLFEDALVLLLHLSTIDEPECRKLSVSATNNVNLLSTKSESKHYLVLLKLQTLRICGQLGDINKEISQLFIESTGLNDYDASTISRKDLKARWKVPPAESNVAVNVDEQLVLEIGIFAISCGRFDAAVHCEAIVKMSSNEMTPCLFLLHHFLRSMLHIECEELYAAFNGREVSTKMDLIQRIEWMNRLLTCCGRVQRRVRNSPAYDDINGIVERVCVYVWSQSNSVREEQKKSLRRTLHKASSLLESCESSLHFHRTQIAVEMARLDLKAKQVGMAKQVLEMAYKLDYGVLVNTGNIRNSEKVSPGGFNQIWALYESASDDQKPQFRRTFDAWLLLLHRKVMLKLKKSSTSKNEILLGINDVAALVHCDRVLSLMNAAQHCLEASDKRKKNLEVISAEKLRLHLEKAYKNLKKGRSSSTPVTSTLNVLQWNELSAFACENASCLAITWEICREALTHCNAVYSLMYSMNMTDKSISIIRFQLYERTARLLGTKLDQLARTQYPYPKSDHPDITLTSDASYRTKEMQDLSTIGAIVNESSDSFARIAARFSGDSAMVNAAAVLDIKDTILQYLNKLVEISESSGLAILLENAGIEIWNHHLCALQRLWYTRSASDLVLIAPECIELMEDVASRLESWSFAKTDKKISLDANRLLLLMSLAVALYYEKAGQFEKSLLLCNNALANRTRMLSAGCPADALLKYFAEIKTRSYINTLMLSKGVSPKERELGGIDDAFFKSLQSPVLQCIALIEAMTYYARSDAQVPTCEKLMDGLYQKVKIIAALEIVSEHVELVEEIELKAEVLVRVGWSVLCHLKDSDFAIECCQCVIKMESVKSGKSNSLLDCSTIAQWVYYAYLVAGKAVLATIRGIGSVPLHLLLQAMSYFMNGAELANSVGLPASQSAELIQCVLSDALTKQQSWDLLPHTAFCDSNKCEISDISAFRAVVVVKIRKLLRLLGHSLPVESSKAVRLELILIALRLANNDWLTASNISKEYWSDFEECSRLYGSKRRSIERSALYEFVRLSAIAAFQVAQNDKKNRFQIEDLMVLSLITDSRDSLMASTTLQKIATACSKDPLVHLQILVKSIQEIQIRNPTAMAQIAQLLVESAEWLNCQGFSFVQVQKFYHLAVHIYPIYVDSESAEEKDKIVIPTRLKQLMFRMRVMIALAMASPTWKTRKAYILAAQSNVIEIWRNIAQDMNEVHLKLQRSVTKDSVKSNTSSRAKQDQNATTITTDSGIKYELGALSQNPDDRSMDFLGFFSTFELNTLHRFRHEWKSLVGLNDKEPIAFEENGDVLLPTHHDMKLYRDTSCASITCYYLEKLIQVLREEEMKDMCLPVVCLHDYLGDRLYTDQPQHTGEAVSTLSISSRDTIPASRNVLPTILRIWSELMLYRSLQGGRRSSIASISLDQALELVQNQVAMYNELEVQGNSPFYQKLSSQPVLTTSVCRTTLSAKDIDLFTKAISIVEMLLELGYIQEGGCVLDIISKASTINVYYTRQWQCVIVKLFGQVKLEQGNIAAAISHYSQHTTELFAPQTAVSVSHHVDLLLTLAEIFVDQKDMTRAFQVLHKVERDVSDFASYHRRSYVECKIKTHDTVSRLELLATEIGRHASPKPIHELEITQEHDHSDTTFPLPLLWLLGRIKFAKARLLIFKKWHTLQETSHAAYRWNLDHIDEATDSGNDAKRAVQDGRRLMGPAGCSWVLIRALTLYQNALQGMLASHINTLQVKEYVIYSQELEFVQDHTLDLLRQLYRDWPEKMDKQVDSAEPCVSQARIDFEIAMQQLKQVEWRLSQAQSFVNVKFHEMTWFEYQKREKLSVVDRWLFETDSGSDVIQEANKRIFLNTKAHLPAEECAKAAITVLARCTNDDYALAGCIFRSQLQRIHLFHDDLNLYKQCWTKFASPSKPEATWIIGNRIVEAVDDAPADHISKEDERISASLSALTSELQSQQKLAFEKSNVNLITRTSYELLQCFGLQHILPAIENLCLYQACVARKKLEDLFLDSLAPHNDQMFHMRQLQKLRLDDNLLPGFLMRNGHEKWNPTPNEGHAFSKSQQHLTQHSRAFNRLQLAINHDARLAFSLLPRNHRIIVLQFSPEKAFIFGAYMSPVSYENTTQDTDYTALARMECSDMDRIYRLQDRIAEWRRGIDQKIHPDDNICESPTPDLIDQVDNFEQQFKEMIEEMSQLLSPLLQHDALRAAIESDLPGKTLILLLDKELSSFPFESLPQLKTADGISRDFSIQTTCQRLEALQKRPFQAKNMLYYIENSNSNDNPSISTVQTDSAGLHHFEQPNGTFRGWKAISQNFTSTGSAESGSEIDYPLTSEDRWNHLLSMADDGGVLYNGSECLLSSALASKQEPEVNIGKSCHFLALLSRPTTRSTKVDGQPKHVIKDDTFSSGGLWFLFGISSVLMNQMGTDARLHARQTRSLLQLWSDGFDVAKSIRNSLRGKPDPDEIDIPGHSSVPEDEQGTKLRAKVSDEQEATATIYPEWDPVIYGLPHLKVV
uniref:Uncharacterized protein AlNc14C11G1363 n=1 Tax=Albugo laibachii Nc14 TaxID=890382 RepID=F0W2Y4_9STRA|nr:conserved hypothetical protein [Albugo laibachii Nc14]|eukprot:CCA15421.1 conserved hypothetical protein [Albugo laibachii Nc14]